MTQSLKLYVRTADQTRRAELDLDAGSTGADIIQAAVDNWSLPADTDYTLVNTTTGKALAPGAKPRFETVMKVARALGVKFTAQPA